MMFAADTEIVFDWHTQACGVNQRTPGKSLLYWLGDIYLNKILLHRQIPEQTASSRALRCWFCHHIDLKPTQNRHQDHWQKPIMTPLMTPLMV
jgi:hypothetical protein